MLPKEVFEEYAKRRLKEIIEKGENPIICCGFIDYFGDAKITQCSKCGVPVFIRPWLLEAVTKYKWSVVCLCCADPKDVTGQVVMNFAKIETTLDKVKK